jgi:hypothetical protein
MSKKQGTNREAKKKGGVRRGKRINHCSPLDVPPPRQSPVRGAACRLCERAKSSQLPIAP